MDTVGMNIEHQQIAMAVMGLARAEWKLRNKRAQWVGEGKPEWSFISREWYARKNASNKLLAYTAKECSSEQKRVLAETAMGIVDSNKPVVMADLVAFISQALA